MGVDWIRVRRANRDYTASPLSSVVLHVHSVFTCDTGANKSIVQLAADVSRTERTDRVTA